MTPKPLLVLLTGTTVPVVEEKHGDFDAHFKRGVGDAWTHEWIAVDARDVDRALPKTSEVAGVIVSGSSSSVTERAPWMLRLEAWLRGAVADETPLLGVCFGHQILAQALGGEVKKNPAGRRIGTLQVKLTDDGARDPLLVGASHDLRVNVSHQDHVAIVPPNVTKLVTADHDPLHAFAAGPRASAVQFHPEFHGEIVRGYITQRRDILKGEGLDPDALLAHAVDAPQAQAILRNFVTSFVLGPGRR
jgi:GMP synthase (glutamine-hydrolysing)